MICIKGIPRDLLLFDDLHGKPGLDLRGDYLDGSLYRDTDPDAVRDAMLDDTLHPMVVASLAQQPKGRYNV